jgi:hypothetical protein
MFLSCRLCQRPTNLWLDFCDECALAHETPALRGVPGGRITRDVQGEDDSERKKENKLTLVHSGSCGDAEPDD